MNRIFIGLVLIFVISCKNKDLDRPFIRSYQELNKESTDIIRTIVKPYEYENDTLRIDKVYKLNLILDSNIYSKEDFEYSYFIGVRFKPDLYDLQIFNINFEFGTISTCRITPNERILVNNLDYLFTDISTLKNCTDLNIPDSLFKQSYPGKPTFHHLGWTNTMYGKWENESKIKFTDNRFNNFWILKPEKIIMIIDYHKDTLHVDTFDLQENSLLIKNAKIEFEVATLTKTRIVLREPGSKDFKILKKK